VETGGVQTAALRSAGTASKRRFLNVDEAAEYLQTTKRIFTGWQNRTGSHIAGSPGGLSSQSAILRGISKANESKREHGILSKSASISTIAITHEEAIVFSPEADDR
jgi:hypothetical protein